MSERVEQEDKEERPDRCQTCRFWEYDPEQDEMIGETEKDGIWKHGECRRMPPTFHVPLGQDFLQRGYKCEHGGPIRWMTGHWPVTIDWEWCGEYQPRKEGE